MIELLKKSIGIISNRRGQVPLCQGCEQKGLRGEVMPTAGKSLGAGTTPGLRGVGKAPGKTANQALLRELVRLHEKYPALGLDSLYHMLKPAFHCSRGRGAPADEGRRHPLPNERGPTKPPPTPATTAPSRQTCSQRQFTFTPPLTKPGWATSPTSPPGEGWLYFAIVKDLCTKKIVGYALFPAHRHPAYPGRPEHGRPPGAPCPLD